MVSEYNLRQPEKVGEYDFTQWARTVC